MSGGRPAFLCAFLTVVAAGDVQARSAGIATIGCDGCHGGGQPATVTISSSNPSPALGSTITLTVTIDAVNGGPAGLYLRHSGQGSFSLVSGQGTKTVTGGGVVHSTPKAPSNGKVTFQVNWSVPNQQGGVDFDAYVLASNGNKNSSGDGAGAARLSLAFGCAGNTYYRDFDADGVGAASSGTTKNCSVPAGYSAADGDCNDNDEQAFPGQTESCNGKDDDCDGATDENLPLMTYYPDADGDGYGVPSTQTVEGCGAPKGYAATKDDCADGDASRNPGAEEVCNFLDDDCDGRVDEGARIVCGVGWCARYGISCDLNLCTPGQPEPETCNYLDDDCDGAIDDGDLCAAGEACVEGACVVEPVSPVKDAGGDGSDPGETPGAGCASAPSLAMTLLIVFALAGWLRPRRRARVPR